MPTWNTESDWDSANSEDGVVHESTSYTDHNDGGTVKRGYRVASPYPSSNLVLYCPLHGNAQDFSGNNRDGTVSGTSTEGAPLGTSSISFDGSSSDYVDYDGSYINPTSGRAVSVSLWVYGDDFSRFERIVNENNNSNGFTFLVDGTDTIECRFENNGSVQSITATISNNEWQHHVMTKNSNDDVEYYINANSKGTMGKSCGGAPYDTRIGGRQDGNEMFGGNLWDFRVYDKHLSDSEIQYLYNVVDTNGSLTTDSRSP